MYNLHINNIHFSFRARLLLPFSRHKNGFKLCFYLLTTLVLGCFLVGCDSNKDVEKINLEKRLSSQEMQELKTTKTDHKIIFGFDLRRSVVEDSRQYVPFLKYLEKATGYQFELRFTSADAKIADDLGSGRFQFAAIGADTYIQAREKYSAIPVVRGLNTKNKAEYQSVLITAPGSPIQSIQELRGKRFAFGSKTSTQGHLIPKIILAQHDITLEDLKSYDWTGSHRNCANEVAAGNFDVGGIQDTLGFELAKAGIVKIMFTSKFYPSSGIAANKDIPPEVLATVKQALINFEPNGKDAGGLYEWDKTEMPNGFVAAQDQDYAELREWSIKLGLLD